MSAAVSSTPATAVSTAVSAAAAVFTPATAVSFTLLIEQDVSLALVSISLQKFQIYCIELSVICYDRGKHSQLASRNFFSCGFSVAMKLRVEEGGARSANILRQKLMVSCGPQDPPFL
jgi:hypothetical protein